jgi:hypothetical protein
MTRTITRSEFQNGAGEAVYVSHVHTASRAEQEAVEAAVQRVVVPAAFIPALSAGEAFDSAEVVPLAFDVVGNEKGPAIAHRQWASLDEAKAMYPPNCDGFDHSGQEPTQAGQVLAHAQHEAAISGAECNGTACLITRGSD